MSFSQIGGWRVRVQYIPMNDAHTMSQEHQEGGMKEETDRTGSILKAGLHIGLDCGLWAIGPVSMETTYQLENQAPWMEEPRGSYLDSLLPKRIPELSVSPNRIIHSVMLTGVWPQAYWCCPLLLTDHLGLRHTNHGWSLIVSFFPFLQTSFRECGEVGLSTYT